MAEIKRVFTVDGKPFFPLGGQSRNSSAYNAAESEKAFEAVKKIHGNTLEIPVYWEQIEPKEGTFDFTAVDELLAGARRNDLKLVLLWFGTWKNGNMEYVPDWVKTQPERFKRVVSPAGRPIWVLSSHCKATFEADRTAFAKLCEHLARKDGRERTVIAVQVENEPGILGSDRDYGATAQADLEAPVPAVVMDAMKAAGKGAVYDLWQAAGAPAAGDWQTVFGDAGGELMTAWSISTYIDGVAAAGQTVYDIPMYINVWLGESGWKLPGDSYPSGGSVLKVLDIYRWCAPHIALIAPDIYIQDVKGYEAVAAGYSRDDNPFFVPESAPGGSNSWLMFRAIADYNAIGYAFFAVEHIAATPDPLPPFMGMIVDSFRCTAAAIPLILEYQGTDRIHAVVEEEGLPTATLELEGYTGLVNFGMGAREHVGKDWRHPGNMDMFAGRPSPERGRGLIFQVSRNEFYMVGANYSLVLRPSAPPASALDASLSKDFLLTRLANYVRVDEGHFDKDGEFVVDRRRNGDETDHGVWVEPDCGVVHVIMCD